MKSIKKRMASVKASLKKMFARGGLIFNTSPVQIMLDPEEGFLYVFEGDGMPSRMYHGIDTQLFHIGAYALSESVQMEINNRLDEIEALLKSFEGVEWNDWKRCNEGVWEKESEWKESLDANPCSISYFYDPDDWFGDSLAEIESLHRAGKSPAEIVDELGCGDVINGMTDREDAIEWVTKVIQDFES